MLGILLCVAAFVTCMADSIPESDDRDGYGWASEGSASARSLDVMFGFPLGSFGAGCALLVSSNKRDRPGCHYPEWNG